MSSLNSTALTNTEPPSCIFFLLIYQARVLFHDFLLTSLTSRSGGYLPGQAKAAEDVRNEAKSAQWSKASPTHGREYPGVVVTCGNSQHVQLKMITGGLGPATIVVRGPAGALRQGPDPGTSPSVLSLGLGTAQLLSWPPSQSPSQGSAQGPCPGQGGSEERA